MKQDFSKPKIIEIEGISDNRGDLFFFEIEKIIDFNIKRVYYITNASSG